MANEKQQPQKPVVEDPKFAGLEAENASLRKRLDEAVAKSKKQKQTTPEPQQPTPEENLRALEAEFDKMNAEKQANAEEIARITAKQELALEDVVAERNARNRLERIKTQLDALTERMADAREAVNAKELERLRDAHGDAVWECLDHDAELVGIAMGFADVLREHVAKHRKLRLGAVQLEKRLRPEALVTPPLTFFGGVDHQESTRNFLEQVGRAVDRFKQHEKERIMKAARSVQDQVLHAGRSPVPLSGAEASGTPGAKTLANPTTAPALPPRKADVLTRGDYDPFEDKDAR